MVFKAKLFALLATVAAWAPVPASGAVPVPAPNALSERVLATLDACHADPLQSARYATFGAQMTQIKRSKSMAVRFDLYERKPADSFRLVAAPSPGFGIWRASDPDVVSLHYSQEVANLPAPAAFRVLVSYRWLDAHKRIVHRTHRTTPLCVLPDERPNLVAGAIAIRRSPDKSSSVYEVAVRNDGLGAAGPFAVSVTVASEPPQLLNIPELAPASQQTLSVQGPKCQPGETISVSLDPAGAIDESSKADNARSQTC